MARRDLTRLNKTERQIAHDHVWVQKNKALCQQYGGRVVVVNKRKILGAGDNCLDALNEARKDAHCPDISRLAIVTVPHAV